MDIGYYHPIIVQFVVAFLFAGVAFRLVSFLSTKFRKLEFTGPTATTLLLLGALAAVLAVKSGDDAHGPAERVPGARDMVEHHEERGEAARNIFLGVALLEIGALVLSRKRYHNALLAASAAVGVVGLLVLAEAAGHGGDVVFSYAGGVGTRSENPEDIDRLLMAALYNSANQARTSGRSADAAETFELMLRRFPNDPNVQLLAIESLIRDRRDGEAALDALRQLRPPSDDRDAAVQFGLLRAAAYVAAGHSDSARSVLEGMLQQFPDNRQISQKLEEIGQ